MPFWFASFSWWLWFRLQVKSYILQFSSFIKTLFYSLEMKSVFSRSDFFLQFLVALPNLGGISVISEVNPESYLVVAFIIKLCVDAHVPDFELTTRLALRCQNWRLCVSLSFYINTIDVTESTYVGKYLPNLVNK